ncbi:MAG TPA: hypothetical protein VKC90_00630 [Chitinophagaceae bacterium]|nr:hypothetical protein [Chitinophagaceae bacterium]
MKKIIAIFCFLIALESNAQNDTSKVEQYCEVVATARMLSNRVTVDIDYGEARSIWKDNRLKDESGRLVKFNTLVDALNYLGRNGWKLVNAFPIISSSGSAPVYHYVFKKEFLKKDTEE